MVAKMSLCLKSSTFAADFARAREQGMPDRRGIPR